MATAKGCKRIGRAAPKTRGGKCGAKVKSRKKTTKKCKLGVVKSGPRKGKCKKRK